MRTLSAYLVWGTQLPGDQTPPPPPPRPAPVFTMSKQNSATLTDYPNKTPKTKSSEPVENHPEFFFDNTLVAIQFGQTMFNVHKYQLVKSKVFSDMFKMPKPEGNTLEEGSSPEHPIRLEGVSASDFAALLRVLYASQFSDNQLAPAASLIIPAFRLANMFNFSKLRAHLLRLAEQNLDDVDNIVFAREFDIKDWLAPAYIRLCQREAVLHAEEASKLDVDSVLLLWRMRDHNWNQINGIVPAADTIYCQNCTGWKYNGHGNWICQHCFVMDNAHYFVYVGPGKMEGKINTHDTTFEAEIKKWVEDTYSARSNSTE